MKGHAMAGNRSEPKRRARDGSRSTVLRVDDSSDERAPVWDSRRRADLRRRLIGWFHRSARDLPWRRTRDIYHVWVSEIMLQQTQVATVIPYFERFIDRFPTIAALASADEPEVLRYWEGLGYYRRARQLHDGARRIVAAHDGRFPSHFQEVLGLPGIGRYTAGAILSIARDERWPILEANTVRLFSRLLLFQGDPRGAQGQSRLWDFATAILPRTRVGQFNQGLMELGSGICRPRDPQCHVCPLRTLCPTMAFGWQDRVPAPPARKKYEDVSEAALVVVHPEQPMRVLLLRRQESERWAGLWDFVRFPVTDPASTDWIPDLTHQARLRAHVDIHDIQPLTTMKHAVTRFRITLHCFTARALVGRTEAGHDRSPIETRWVPMNQLDTFPLSATGRRICRMIHQVGP